MMPGAIDPKKRAKLIEHGLQREQKMLQRLAKGELGPTMSCVFNDTTPDPLAYLTPEEFKTLTNIYTKKNQFVHAKKRGTNTPSLSFEAGERKVIKKVRHHRPTWEERQNEKKLIKKLSLELSPWSTMPTDELSLMDADTKLVVTSAQEEFSEDVYMSPGEEDPIRDAKDIDLGPFDEEIEEMESLLPALTVDFLDVGMGDSALFVCGDGTTVLIDCGSASTIDTGAQDALKFLATRLRELKDVRKLSAPRIDRIYLTHCDQDHYNLLPSLFALVPDLEVPEFHIGGQQKQYKQKRDVFGHGALDTMATLFSKGTVHEYMAPSLGDPSTTLTSERSFTGGPVSFRTLCANTVPRHKETKANAASVVVLVEMPVDDPRAEPVKILMVGDAETTVEKVLLANHAAAIQNCTLLHVGHHGSQIAAGTDFLQHVNPRVGQISADQRWAHPYSSTVERITDDPTLRINEAMRHDKKHWIVVGEGAGKTKEHKQIKTKSALIMNISEQRIDMSDSDKAKAARKEGLTPTKAIGAQWQIQFNADGTHKMSSTRRNDNVVFL